MRILSHPWLAAVPIPLFLVLGGTLFVRLLAAPPPQVEMAGYATSLKGRSSSQRHNAVLAAVALDGKVVPPGGVFSFNRATRSWSVDQGYVKAPVSYDGELVRSFGGGVCQVSTTLYNAALLAGVPILERHPHVYAPHYIPPGQDAAVAYPGIDLRFRNPYPWPIRVRVAVRGDSLLVRLWGAKRPLQVSQVTTRVLATTVPERLTQVFHRPTGATPYVYLRSPGATGYRVVAYRVSSQDGRELRRERLSDDTYPAMNRVVRLTEEETPAIVP